ncbi:MAG: carbohydrate kinase [Chloroflexi bacterium]|nr:carbohydrate kinase [Chloroflexota bacterium]
MLEVTSLGEVLWDIIGQEKHLGGAPFNFAAHCQQLGAHSLVISRIGEDELGVAILAQAERLHMDAHLIQRDPTHPTGQVLVRLQADGQPEYDIRAEVAYDYLMATPEAITRASQSDIICFGTLAQRHPDSRRAIAELIHAATDALIVCDLNLRPPHFSEQIVRDSMARCDVLKLNDTELRTVQVMMGWSGSSGDACMLQLLDTFDLELLCVTLGARGCILRTRAQRVAAPGYRCQVADTVGAGDAFAAALVVRYASGCSLEETADFANLVGAYVATQRGAIPPITPDRLMAFAAETVRAPSSV